MARERAAERHASLRWRLPRDVGLPLLLTRLALLLVTLTAPQWPRAIRSLVLPDPGRFHSGAPADGGPLFSAWYRWDAEWYLRIAGNGPQMGYSAYWVNKDHHFSAFAFFPLYPLTVRAVATLAPGALDAVPYGGPARPQLIAVSLVVSNVIFALALVALYLLALARAGPAAARRAVWLLCLFPTSVFFSAPYSEGLFLLWLALFFLMLYRGHWWLAGLCGALAAATRSLGVALVLPYLAAYIQQILVSPRRRGDTEALTPQPPLPTRGRGEDARRGASLRGSVAPWWGELLPVALIPCGLLAYMAYLGLAWHDPLAFRKAEDAWGRSFQLPWVGIYDGLTWSLQRWPHLGQPNWRGLTDALFALVFLVLTAWAWRDLDWTERAYATVFWIYVLCPASLAKDHYYSDTLISMARFLLVLVPLWLWLARSRLGALAVALPSALFFLVYAGRWVLGGWIG